MTKGAKLELLNREETARHVADLWTNYSLARMNALKIGQEARQYVMATDTTTTTASVLNHKNKTHLPKLTEISDRLQFQYWKAVFGRPDFFRFEVDGLANRTKARNIEALLRTKLEQQNFRQTVGRELIADYVLYGNVLAGVSFVSDSINGKIVYRGPKGYRRSPLDVSFNPMAKSFKDSAKVERELLHIGDLIQLPERYVNAGYKPEVIAQIQRLRSPGVMSDYIDQMKKENIQFDGFNTLGDYFTQDMVEVLIYRGDVYNRQAGTLEKNRIVTVVDRLYVIRNEPNTSPTGFDGLHHAGWRIRTDNLWGMGPLDNLVGMQYRIDHLENLKADGFDLVVQPPLKIRGDEVQEPENGYAPGATYYLGSEEDADVELMSPNIAVLQADNEINYYSQLMEQFAGAPPQKSGIRTPGEKTAFEVDVLESNSTEMFLDKVQVFEAMLETMLQEMFEVLLANFDGTEYALFFDDITGATELEELTYEDIQILRGKFKATGSYHWEKNRRKTQEMVSFYSSGAAQDPKIRYHMSGEKLADYWNERMETQNEGIFEAFAGVKEDVLAQAIAQAEQQAISNGQPQGSGQPSGDIQNVQQPGVGPHANPIGTPQL